MCCYHCSLLSFLEAPAPSHALPPLHKHWLWVGFKSRGECGSSRDSTLSSMQSQSIALIRLGVLKSKDPQKADLGTSFQLIYQPFYLHLYRWSKRSALTHPLEGLSPIHSAAYCGIGNSSLKVFLPLNQNLPPCVFYPLVLVISSSQS